MSVKTFKKAQVEEHNKRTDLWIILHDKVYDVTKFLNEHPGGDEVLEEAAGKDATKDFDDVGHSDEAIEQLKNYYLGDIIDEEKKEKKKPSKKDNTQNKQTKYCIAGISILVIAIGAILIYKGCRMCK